MKMKREFRDAKKLMLPSAWHPDFRHTEELPHASVERVVFLLNVFVIALPILLAISEGAITEP